MTTKNVKLMLVVDGIVIDSAELTTDEFIAAQEHPAGAQALLRELG